MPDQSSHDAALKAGKHVLFGSFFLFEYGDPVAIYTVDTTPSFPTYDLDVTLGSGSASAVKYGMVYTVETSGGKSKGAGTLRYAGTISSGNLPVRELSRGVIDVAAGDLVKVYRYWIPVDKLVGATIDFNPDGLSYSDQGSNPPPVGVNGGAWAGFPSQLPLPLTDSLGYVVDPDSSSAVTVSRTLPAGLSYASGDDTTLDVTVEGDEGTYWIETVVTDPDNSKSLTRYTPVCINAHPLDCTVEPYGGDVDNGWRMTVTFREQVDIPRGMWGAFVVREFIDGVEGSFGASAPGRSHIKFFGMVRRRSAEGSGADGVQTVSYEFVSPLAWLLETPGFSKVMLNDASPDAWHKMKGLDTKRAPLQIFQFYSNAPHILDITFRDNYRVKDYPGFFLEKNTPIAQVRELADGVGARLICTRQGAFEFHTRLRFLPLADRSSAVTMLTPSLDSILRYSLNVEMKDPLEKLYFLGFVGGILPFPIPFRIAYPGKAPGTGVDSPQFDKMICDSLADAEREAGRRGAMVQGKFIGTDGEAREAHTVELVLYGSLDVFDLYGEWVKLPALPNVARIDTSKYRYELDSINIENTAGTARVTLRLSSETNGVPGQYDPPPPEDSAGFPDFDWDYGDPVGLPPTSVLIGAGTGRILAIAEDGYLYYTLDRGQTWARINLSPTGSILDFVPDPWSPAYQGSGTDVWLHVLTTTRIARAEFNAQALTLTGYTNNETHTAVALGRIEMERAVRNLVVALTQRNNAATEVVRTTDGANWSSPVLINADGALSGTAGLYVSGKVPGRVYVSESKRDAGVTAGKVSSSGGASFGALSSPTLASAEGAFSLHIPWHDNNDQIAYYGYDDVPDGLSGSGVRRTYRAVGAAQVDISPNDGGTFGPQMARSLDTSPQNRLLVAGCLRRSIDASLPNSDPVRVYYSLNGGDTWTSIAALNGTPGGGAYWNVRFAGDAPVFWAFGDGGRIALCDLNGNYEDWSGNLPSFSPGRLLNIAGF